MGRGMEDQVPRNWQAGAAGCQPQGGGENECVLASCLESNLNS